MPVKVIPIADDVFGNEICFDFRKGLSSPSIVFQDHEIAFEDPERAIFNVSLLFIHTNNKSKTLLKLYKTN